MGWVIRKSEQGSLLAFVEHWGIREILSSLPTRQIPKPTRWIDKAQNVLYQWWGVRHRPLCGIAPQHHEDKAGVVEQGDVARHNLREELHPLREVDGVNALDGGGVVPEQCVHPEQPNHGIVGPGRVHPNASVEHDLHI